MAQYENRVTTIRDILKKSVAERKSEYGVDFGDKHIDKVTINGNVFTDYKAFSFLWEKTYVKSPERSTDGTIGNLDSYATFLTPHLKIDFGMMSIVSYRKIMQLIYSANEFIVTCYDVVNNKDTTNKMYFSTEEMPKLWTLARAMNGEEWVELLGVEDYTVEMIGTNIDVDTYTVRYYLNSPTGLGQTTPIYSQQVAIGEDIVIGQNTSIENEYFSNYVFNGTWKLGSVDGTTYNNGDSFTISKAVIDEDSKSVDFYADWKSTSTFTLTFSYGLGEQQIDTNTMQYITSRQVEYNAPIGSLPNSPIPTVTYGEGDNEKVYTPYSNGGWYKTSIKTQTSVKLTENTPYWLENDTTIYQVFDVAQYTVTYIVDGKEFSNVQVQYGTAVPMPNLAKEGYIFKGWCFDYNGKNITSLIMPPFNIKLTAVFEE